MMEPEPRTKENQQQNTNVVDGKYVVTSFLHLLIATVSRMQLTEIADQT